MKLALLGYGKMGRLIEEMAQQQNFSIVAKKGQTFNQMERFAEVDVCIDFSHPSSVLEHIKLACSYKKPIIIGTTGWLQHLEEAQRFIYANENAALYAANFSLGIYLFSKIITEAARLMNHFSEYDVSFFEMHHRLKKDSPSGTSHQLLRLLLENIERKKTLHTDSSVPPTHDALCCSSLRCGDIPGSHTVCFDSANDTITLTHEARNRMGFAQGAILAAHWISGKKGWFTLEDFMNEKLEAVWSH